MTPTTAPCVGLTAVFFPTELHGSRTRTAYNTAKKICAECPHVTPCGDGALERGEPVGVWGGLSPADREVILGRRIRGATRVHGRQAIDFLTSGVV